MISGAFRNDRLGMEDCASYEFNKWIGHELSLSQAEAPYKGRRTENARDFWP